MIRDKEEVQRRINLESCTDRGSLPSAERVSARTHKDRSAQSDLLHHIRRKKLSERHHVPVCVRRRCLRWILKGLQKTVHWRKPTLRVNGESARSVRDRRWNRTLRPL
eukprot:766716-Hanusia_phi.AAC.3